MASHIESRQHVGYQGKVLTSFVSYAGYVIVQGWKMNLKNLDLIRSLEEIF